MKKPKEIDAEERQPRDFSALEQNVGIEIALEFKKAFPDGYASISEMIAVARRCGITHLVDYLEEKRRKETG